MSTSNDAPPDSPLTELSRVLPTLSLFLREVDDGIFVQNAGRQIIFANDAAARLCGFPSASELLNTPIGDVLRRFALFDEVGAPFPLEQLPAQRVLAGESVPEVLLRWVVLATGVEHWSAVRATPVRGAQGEVQFVVSVFRDVTERRNAEAMRTELTARLNAAYAEAEAERQRLNDLLMQAPAAICHLRGPEHVFALANANYRQLVGRDDLIGKAIRDVFPQTEIQDFVDLLDNVYRTGRAFHGNEIPLHINRQNEGMIHDIYLNAVYQPTRDATGVVNGILVHSVDVTEEVLARRRSEELATQLTLERDKLQQVIDVLPEAVLIADTTPTFTMSNRAAHDILGDEARGMPVPVVGLDAFTIFGTRRPDGTPYPSDELPLERAVLQGETVRGDEFTIRNMETTRDVTVLANSAPLRDASGAVTGGVVIFQDITARKHTESQARFLAEASVLLAESLEYEVTLQRIADLAVPAVADWCGVDMLDDAGNLTPIAVGHRDPAKIALGFEVRRRYPPNPNDPSGTAAALRTGTSILVPEISDSLLEATAIDADHLAMLRALGLHSMMVIPLIARGRGLGTLTLIASDPSRTYGQDDLTFAEELGRRAAFAIDNARLYRNLEAAETRYRGLFESTADAVLLSDEAGNAVDGNPALCDLLGYRRDELIGLRVSNLAADQIWGLEESERHESNGLWRGELELRRKNGTPVPVEGWLTKVLLPAGPLFLGTFRDITARREAEEERRRFIAMIAHELRNPLAAILGFSELLLRRGQFDARRIETIITQAKRLERLTLDLRETVRAEAQGYRLTYAPVDVPALIRATVEQTQATTTAHVIVAETPDRLPAALWDADRMAQVLGNLILNAIRYTPADGEIRVTVADHGDTIQISVADSGIGIPSEDLTRVFEPFYRATNAQEGSARGMGLGLAITKSLVEAHGGTITVVSSPGRGTTFTLTIPYTAPLAMLDHDAVANEPAPASP